MKLMTLLYTCKSFLFIGGHRSVDNTICSPHCSSWECNVMFQPLHDKFSNHRSARAPTELHSVCVEVKFSQNSAGTGFIRLTPWARPLLFKTQPQYTVEFWALEHKHGRFLWKLVRSWHFPFSFSFFLLWTVVSVFHKEKSLLHS